MTDRGADQRERIESSHVHVIGISRLTIAILQSDGNEALLTEGGPTAIGGLLEAGLLDELSLTLSPILAGRSAAGGRPGLIEGIELVPSRASPLSSRAFATMDLISSGVTRSRADSSGDRG